MRKWIGIVAAAVVLPPGGFAVMHLMGVDSQRPWVRVTVVVGDSMKPTLKHGDGLVFARMPWHRGDIVLADVNEADPVVKRVGMMTNGYVLLHGDNADKSANYYVPREQVMGKLLCPLWRFTRAAAKAPQRAPAASPCG